MRKNIRLLNWIFKFIPAKTALKIHYRTITERKLNLKKPQRFTEKIHFYKINYKNNLMTVCADKYKMREFITKLGYHNYLSNIYQVLDRIEDLNVQLLPDKFVIKANNGSGTNIFISRKRDFNIKTVTKITNKWSSVSTINIGKEWAYKNINKKIIVEEFIDDYEDGETCLRDYKVMCFHGEPKLVWVDINRNSNHKRNFYDLEWNQIQVESDKDMERNILIEKPSRLDEMLSISKSISKFFPFSKIDFYYTKSKKLYIGEITFYPWSGSVNFRPDSFDFELGKLFDLNKLLHGNNIDNNDFKY